MLRQSLPMYQVHLLELLFSLMLLAALVTVMTFIARKLPLSNKLRPLAYAAVVVVALVFLIHIFGVL